MELLITMQKACQKLIDTEGADEKAMIVVRGILDHEVSPNGELYEFVTKPANGGNAAPLYFKDAANCTTRERCRAHDVALALMNFVFEEKAYLPVAAIDMMFEGKEDSAGWHTELA